MTGRICTNFEQILCICWICVLKSSSLRHDCFSGHPGMSLSCYTQVHHTLAPSSPPLSCLPTHPLAERMSLLVALIRSFASSATFLSAWTERPFTLVFACIFPRAARWSVSSSTRTARNVTDRAPSVLSSM